jgi:hypothetical protein
MEQPWHALTPGEDAVDTGPSWVQLGRCGNGRYLWYLLCGFARVWRV